MIDESKNPRAHAKQINAFLIVSLILPLFKTKNSRAAYIKNPIPNNSIKEADPNVIVVTNVLLPDIKTHTY
jgi:hypothetical protein